MFDSMEWLYFRCIGPAPLLLTIAVAIVMIGFMGGLMIASSPVG